MEELTDIFGKPYDLAVFGAANAEGATFDILHFCRENIMPDLIDQFPGAGR